MSEITRYNLIRHKKKFLSWLGLCSLNIAEAFENLHIALAHARFPAAKVSGLEPTAQWLGVAAVLSVFLAKHEGFLFEGIDT